MFSRKFLLVTVYVFTLFADIKVITSAKATFNHGLGKAQQAGVCYPACPVAQHLASPHFQCRGVGGPSNCGNVIGCCNLPTHTDLRSPYISQPPPVHGYYPNVPHSGFYSNAHYHHNPHSPGTDPSRNAPILGYLVCGNAPSAHAGDALEDSDFDPSEDPQWDDSSDDPQYDDEDPGFTDTLRDMFSRMAQGLMSLGSGQSSPNADPASDIGNFAAPSGSVIPPPTNADPTASFAAPSGSFIPQSVNSDPPSSFAAPSGSFIPPSVNSDPPSSFAAPSGSFIPPSVNSDPPSSFAAPSGSFIPSSVNSDPPSSFAAPSGSFIPSSVNSDPPSSFAAPSGSFIPPSLNSDPPSSFAAPSGSFIPPSINSDPPSSTASSDPISELGTFAAPDGNALPGPVDQIPNFESFIATSQNGATTQSIETVATDPNPDFGIEDVDAIEDNSQISDDSPLQLSTFESETQVGSELPGSSHLSDITKYETANNFDHIPTLFDDFRLNNKKPPTKILFKSNRSREEVQPNKVLGNVNKIRTRKPSGTAGSICHAIRNSAELFNETHTAPQIRLNPFLILTPKNLPRSSLSETITDTYFTAEEMEALYDDALDEDKGMKVLFLPDSELDEEQVQSIVQRISLEIFEDEGKHYQDLVLIPLDQSEDIVTNFSNNNVNVNDDECRSAWTLPSVSDSSGRKYQQNKFKSISSSLFGDFGTHNTKIIGSKTPISPQFSKPQSTVPETCSNISPPCPETLYLSHFLPSGNSPEIESSNKSDCKRKQKKEEHFCFQPKAKIEHPAEIFIPCFIPINNIVKEENQVSPTIQYPISEDFGVFIPRNCSVGEISDKKHILPFNGIPFLKVPGGCLIPKDFSAREISDEEPTSSSNVIQYPFLENSGSTSFEKDCTTAVELPNKKSPLFCKVIRYPFPQRSVNTHTTKDCLAAKSSEGLDHETQESVVSTDEIAIGSEAENSNETEIQKDYYYHNSRATDCERPIDNHQIMTNTGTINLDLIRKIAKINDSSSIDSPSSGGSTLTEISDDCHYYSSSSSNCLPSCNTDAPEADNLINLTSNPVQVTDDEDKCTTETKTIVPDCPSSSTKIYIIKINESKPCESCSDASIKNLIDKISRTEGMNDAKSNNSYSEDFSCLCKFLSRYQQEICSSIKNTDEEDLKFKETCNSPSVIQPTIPKIDYPSKSPINYVCPCELRNLMKQQGNKSQKSNECVHHSPTICDEIHETEVSHPFLEHICRIDKQFSKLTPETLPIPQKIPETEICPPTNEQINKVENIYKPKVQNYQAYSQRIPVTRTCPSTNEYKWIEDISQPKAPTYATCPQKIPEICPTADKYNKKIENISHPTAEKYPMYHERIPEYKICHTNGHIRNTGNIHQSPTQTYQTNTEMCSTIYEIMKKINENLQETAQVFPTCLKKIPEPMICSTVDENIKKVENITQLPVETYSTCPQKIPETKTCPAAKENIMNIENTYQRKPPTYATNLKICPTVYEYVKKIDENPQETGQAFPSCFKKISEPSICPTADDNITSLENTSQPTSQKSPMFLQRATEPEICHTHISSTAKNNQSPTKTYQSNPKICSKVYEYVKKIEENPQETTQAYPTCLKRIPEPMICSTADENIKKVDNITQLPVETYSTSPQTIPESKTCPAAKENIMNIENTYQRKPPTYATNLKMCPTVYDVMKKIDENPQEIAQAYPTCLKRIPEPMICPTTDENIKEVENITQPQQETYSTCPQRIPEPKTRPATKEHVMNIENTYQRKPPTYATNLKMCPTVYDVMKEIDKNPQETTHAYPTCLEKIPEPIICPKTDENIKDVENITQPPVGTYSKCPERTSKSKVCPAVNEHITSIEKMYKPITQTNSTTRKTCPTGNENILKNQNISQPTAESYRTCPRERIQDPDICAKASIHTKNIENIYQPVPQTHQTCSQIYPTANENVKNIGNIYQAKEQTVSICPTEPIKNTENCYQPKEQTVPICPTANEQINWTGNNSQPVVQSQYQETTQPKICPTTDELRITNSIVSDPITKNNSWEKNAAYSTVESAPCYNTPKKFDNGKKTIIDNSCICKLKAALEEHRLENCKKENDFPKKPYAVNTSYTPQNDPILTNYIPNEEKCNKAYEAIPPPAKQMVNCSTNNVHSSPSTSCPINPISEVNSTQCQQKRKELLTKILKEVFINNLDLLCEDKKP